MKYLIRCHIEIFLTLTHSTFFGFNLILTATMLTTLIYYTESVAVLVLYRRIGIDSSHKSWFIWAVRNFAVPFLAVVLWRICTCRRAVSQRRGNFTEKRIGDTIPRHVPTRFRNRSRARRVVLRCAPLSLSLSFFLFPPLRTFSHFELAVDFFRDRKPDLLEDGLDDDDDDDRLTRPSRRDLFAVQRARRERGEHH